jgi:hypothetical protein
MVVREWRFPDRDIDHIDGCRTNNRIENLRDISRSENLQNVRGPRSTNAHGVLGVLQKKGSKTWRAQICVNGIYRKTHSFKTKEEAGAAYLALKAELHKGYVGPPSVERSDPAT